MAKKSKGPRAILALKCSVCNRQNYISERNKNNTIEKLALKKYCKKCRKHLIHKETSKLK
jgi:large subunit ribosomal protein L33